MLVDFLVNIGILQTCSCDPIFNLVNLPCQPPEGRMERWIDDRWVTRFTRKKEGLTRNLSIHLFIYLSIYLSAILCSLWLLVFCLLGFLLLSSCDCFVYVIMIAMICVWWSFSCFVFLPLHYHYVHYVVLYCLVLPRVASCCHVVFRDCLVLSLDFLAMSCLVLPVGIWVGVRPDF